jgi:hypothetical protein
MTSSANLNRPSPGPPPRPTADPASVTSAPTTHYRVVLVVVTAIVLACSFAFLEPLASLRTLSGGVGHQPLEVVILALIHLGAAAVAAWVTIVAVLTAAAWASGAPRLARVAVRAAPPALRALVERGLPSVLGGVVLLTGPSPAFAAPPPPPGLQVPVVETSGVGTSGVEPSRIETSPLPTWSAGSGAGGPVVAPPAPGGAAAARTATSHDRETVAADRSAPESSWTVGHGDSLWSIAVAHLEHATGEPPTAREAAAYWSEVVAANQAGLRSGEPDLIRPGETITLPPI